MPKSASLPIISNSHHYLGNTMTKKSSSTQQIRYSMKKLKIIGLVIITLLVANIGYQVWNNYYAMHNPQGAYREPCDLRDKACRVHMPQGRTVELGIRPRRIPSEKPVDIDINLNNIKAKQVRLSILPLAEKQIPPQHLTMEKHSGSRYRAKATLNQSDYENNEWLAIVIIESDQEGEPDIAIPYKFESSQK